MLSRSLIRRLTQLHDREIIVVGHPNWRKPEPLTARVIGWSYDAQNDDEPLVDVRFSSDLPKHWADQTDYILLSQVQSVRKPVAVPTCQRQLAGQGA